MDHHRWLTQKIEVAVVDCVRSIADKKLPSLSIDGQNLVFTEHGCTKFGRIFTVLKQVHTQLQTGEFITKRDLYYKYKDEFNGEERTVDATIDAVCRLLGCRREQLNIIASAKGLLFGDVLLTMSSGQTIDCRASDSGTLISDHLDAIADINLSKIGVVLIVEKHAVFQKLCNHDVLNKLNGSVGKSVLIMTAKGYPDLNSRAFLYRVSKENPSLPLLCLTDCNPHGVEIMLTYKFGSAKSSAIAPEMPLAGLVWIGLKPSELKLFPISASKLMRLGTTDGKKLKSLLTREQVFQDQELAIEVMCFRDLKFKAELECLDHLSPNYFVSRFLPFVIERALKRRN